MSGVDDLATWLRAQLDDDERVAQAEVDLLRDYPYPADFRVEYQWVRMARHPHGGTSTTFAPGAPTPARVLAEVDAKRKLIDLYEAARRRQQDNSAKFVLLTKQRYLDQAEFARVKTHGWELGGQVAALRMAVAVAAVVYADRPGYQQEWHPA